MTDKRCPDCKFSAQLEPKGPLKCTRNPPSVTAFIVPGRLQGQSQIVEHSAFPLATTPCGEFSAAKVESIEEIWRRRIPITTPEQPQATHE